MRHLTRICWLLGLVLLGSCGRQGLEPADVVFTNGSVLTLDAAYTNARTAVVRDGVVIAVGGPELADEYAAAVTVDLAGRTLLPGFNDSHTHIRGYPPRHIDLTVTRSIEQLVEQVRDKAAELGAGEWITGYGWSEDVMAEQRRPFRSDLDRAAPDNPVLLTRAGGHSAVANSLALDMAGVYRNTPDPEGGVIERDEEGELNGIIRERQNIVGDLVPEATWDEVRPSFVAELRRQLSLGITSLTHATGSIETFAEWQEVYASHSGELPRAAVQVFWESPEAMAAFGKRSGDGDEFLRVGPIKIFVDGGFTGPAAYTREPYKGEDSYRGKLSLEPEELRRIIRGANAAGWQLGIHAIGDAAIELAVDELALALDASPRADHRHYLNHFTVMPPPATMETMAGYGIAISQQPNFTYTVEGRYVDYLDGNRLEHNNPLRTPISHGIHVAISSDILPIGPMVGVYAAVTRKGMSGRVYAADEALTLQEALRAYTWGGAWLNFDEDRKGTIQPGRVADLVVLDRDIMQAPAEGLLDVRVDQTWLGGRKVFERGE
ncbi:MAG: amidohydrolase [Gammaproteobacteria bacterium]|nr:amidohydrolase [Gammaproteobacteria bacterium]MDH4254116.1 amidohydrolase [Gammaproteobacteria bacterium]MDH5309064.1 amidohydrolase [Gammaproteobacteria bacterium]